MKVNQSNDLEKDKSVGSFPMFGLLTYLMKVQRTGGTGIVLCRNGDYTPPRNHPEGTWDAGNLLYATSFRSRKA